MSPRKENLAIKLARVTGWAFLLLFGLTTFTAVPVGAGVIGAFGSLLVALFPGLALIYGIRAAFLGDRYWWLVSVFALTAATLIIASTAFIDSTWAILTLPAYIFTLYPMVTLLRSGRPDLATEPNGRIYTIGYLALVGAFLALVWLTQLFA